MDTKADESSQQENIQEPQKNKNTKIEPLLRATITLKHRKTISTLIILYITLTMHLCFSLSGHSYLGCL